MSQLRTQIRQKRPFDSPAEEAFLNVVRTANLLLRSLTRELKEGGLTQSQYNALRILRGAHPDSLACGDVGSRMVTPEPDVTRLLDRLENRGLIERNRDPSDRRVVQARITNEGLDRLSRLDEPVRARLEEDLGGMNESELRSLIELCETARQRVDPGS